MTAAGEQVVPPPVAIDDLADDLETIRLAKAEIKKWKSVQDAAQEKVLERVGEAEAGTVGGRTAVTVPHREVWRIQSTALRRDIGDEELKRLGYLKPSHERRLELVD